MLKGKKEKQVQQLVGEHFEIVEQCVKAAVDTVECYLNEDMDGTTAMGLETDRLEREADQMRRKIYNIMGTGAFMPILRGDIHCLVEEIDDLADCAEDVGDVISGERPDIPREFHETIRKIMDSTFKQCQLAQKIIGGFFGLNDNMQVQSGIDEITKIEREIDALEWDVTRQIFSSELPLANKLHLKQFLHHLSSISDKAEDVMDVLSELMIKMKA